MCGIIAIVRRPSERPAPDPATVRALLDQARAGVEALESGPTVAALNAATRALADTNRLLYGAPGITTLIADPILLRDVGAECAAIGTALARTEALLDQGELEPAEGFEPVNAAVIRLKDALWAVERDRLRAAAGVADLAGPEPSPSAVAALTSVHQALSAIDRLEVRGRDSAGIEILVRNHGLDFSSPAISQWLAARRDPLFRSQAVATPAGHLAFVYKAAAEIG